MRLGLLAPLVTRLLPEQLGGSQALVVDLARGLMDRGHDVTLFAASGSIVEGLPVEEIEVDASRMSRNLFKATPGWRREELDVLRDAFAQAYEQISKARLDIVHNHGFDPPAFSEAQKADTPVLHTLHLPYDTEVADALDVENGSRATLTVAVSNAHAIEWGRSVDAVVPNGVPTDLIPWSRTRERFALFAGRLSPEKGVMEAVQIARRANIPLIIAGNDYDAEYAMRVRAEAQRQVTFMGPVTRRSLWDLMSRAQVLLAPSRWNEPFSLAAAEAQAAGCAVVAFDRGALSEVIEEGISGFTVPEGDLEAASEAVNESPNLDPSNIRASADRRLDASQMIDGYEALYSQIVSVGDVGATVGQ